MTFPVLSVSLASFLSGVWLSVCCEPERPAFSSAQKLVVQPFAASVEQCLDRYSGHPVVLFVNTQWSPEQLLSNTYLNSPQVTNACIRYNAVVVLADMTGRMDELYQLNRRHGTSGVPYLAIYPADRSQPPYISEKGFTPESMARDIHAALGTP